MNRQRKVVITATYNDLGMIVDTKVEELPSANRSGRRGKWIDEGDPLTLGCSECDYRVARYNNTNYCPNCGADMRGEDDD